MEEEEERGGGEVGGAPGERGRDEEERETVTASGSLQPSLSLFTPRHFILFFSSPAGHSPYLVPRYPLTSVRPVFCLPSKPPVMALIL